MRFWLSLHLSCFVLAVFSAAGAQQLPFEVLVVDWQPGVLKAQSRAYRTEAERNEVLFCVESWQSRVAGQVKHILITKVRRARGGARHGVADVADDCMAADGSPLPTIHTHSDGNCQFSPSDLVAVAGRRAEFQGAQCGDRHIIWTTAMWVVALANGAEAMRTVSKAVPP